MKIEKIRNNIVLHFPEIIKFENAVDYETKLKSYIKHLSATDIIFNLSKTENITSSFTGFLLNSIQEFENLNFDIEIILSKRLKHLFEILDLSEILNRIK